MSGAKQALQAMNEENLPEKFGEAPSRWGQGGEAQRVALFDLDRKTAAILYEAELYTALCYLLGEPVDLKFPQHPLDNRGSSGGKRQYFDLEITPDSTRGWLEYAWRLQMVTQDHNYGGIDGAQSEFDKLLYKKAAFAIAQNAVDQALGRLCREIPGDEKSVVVWNNLNWSRNGSVLLPNGIWESEKPCHAVSSGGEICPVVLGENGLELYPSDIPSVGYETFHIESGAAPVHFFESFYRETESSIELCDSRWRLRFNKRTGVLESVFERTLDQEMVGGTEALAVYCYADYSSGVDERAADRKVLDCSKEHVQSVRLYRAGPVKSCVRIESSICNNKIQIDVILNHQNGEIDVCPRIFWDGAASVQIKLILPLGHQMGTLRYGVAYGEQTYGNYLEDPDFIATDEIDPILYQRYRKVNGWYAYCGKKYGLAVILEHGTMDFCGEETGVTLIRDTRNCGDLDVRTSNEGKHEWRFTVQSYRGRLEDFHPARRAYERLHPLVATQPGGGSQPPRRSFLDTAGAGILTAFMESENGAILRLYNDQTERQKLNLQFDFPVGKVTPVDLLGRPENSQPDILNAFEIKTLSLMKQEKNE